MSPSIFQLVTNDKMENEKESLELLPTTKSEKIGKIRKSFDIDN